jgi:orotidine-5'-phosphate decarboxylase
MLGTEPFLVTPGIRPSGADFQDQKRIMTPAQAIETGSFLHCCRATYFNGF